MAFTQVLERKRNEDCNIARAARTYTREFIVASSTEVSLYAVRLADDGTNAVPLYGEAHPDDSAALCSEIKITRMWEQTTADSDGEFKYLVVCNYTSEQRVAVLSTSPLLRPWEFRWQTENSTEPYFVDKSLSGLFVTNSTGEAFDEMPQRLKKGVSVTITRNQASNPSSLIKTFDKTVNSGSVTIDGESYSAGELFMAGVTGDKVNESGTEYYRVTFDVKINADGWHDKILDVGYSQLDGSGNRIKIIDGTNTHLSKPWPLNGSGEKMPNATDLPAERDFQPYEEKSWAGLSFT